MTPQERAELLVHIDTVQRRITALRLDVADGRILGMDLDHDPRAVPVVRDIVVLAIRDLQLLLSGPGLK